VPEKKVGRSGVRVVERKWEKRGERNILHKGGSVRNAKKYSEKKYTDQIK